MARGALTGLLFGGGAAIVGLGLVSLIAPLPTGPDIAPDPASVSAPAETGDAAGTASGRDADLVEIAPTAPGDQPGADDLSALRDGDTDPMARPTVGGDSDSLSDPQATGTGPDVPASSGATAPADQAGTAPQAPAGADSSPTGTDTAPARRPDVAGATGGLDTPSEAGDAPDVAAIAERPAAPAQPGGALTTPQGGDAPISSEPAQPSMPEVSDSGSGFGAAPETGQTPEIEVTRDAAVDTTDQTDAMTQPGRESDPDASTDPAAQPSQTGTEPTQPDTAVAAGSPEPASPEQPVQAPVVATEPPAQPVPDMAGSAATDPAAPPAPRIAALPQSGTSVEGGGDTEETGDTGPRIGTRVTPLTERDGNRSRLPAVTKAAAETTAEDGPPIQRYAAAFENPQGKPLMAIVLIDDIGAVGAEALQEFPYPLSFAVDPSDPEAIDKILRHRAAGFEVALLTNLPAAATAQDAEISLGAALAALPETVAIFEGVGSGFQGNRELSDQVTAIAEGTGRGLVTQSNGLNTVQKLAARKGVPSAVVFRDFDGAGQSPDTMRRFLDQAAFRADQEGGVVMLGRVRPVTISALLLWGLQDRASRVALAPLSAALLRVGLAQ